VTSKENEKNEEEFEATNEHIEKYLAKNSRQITHSFISLMKAMMRSSSCRGGMRCLRLRGRTLQQQEENGR
jgi:hypothetical protein